jgi:hypothetical protein
MDMVTIVYEGPNEAKWITWGGDGYIFEQGVAQEVPKGLAQNLIENNPEPWQPAYCDRYAIVDGGEG